MGTGSGGPAFKALKAAMFGGGYDPVEYFGKLYDVIPGMETAFVNCPCDCGGIYNNIDLTEAITHLNDEHMWSFERIANWIDTLPHDLKVVENE